MSALIARKALTGKMNCQAKIELMLNRYEVSIKRVSAMTEIPMSKIKAIIEGRYLPTPAEMHRIDIAIGVAKSICNGIDYTGELAVQKGIVSNTILRLTERYPDAQNELESLMSESMYLGQLLCQSNKSESVYQAVRNTRGQK